MLNDNNPDPNGSPSGNGNGVTAVLEQVEATLSVAKEQLAALEKQVARARGTGNVTKQAARAARATRATGDLGVRIAEILRREVATTEELAREIGEPMSKIQAKLKEMRQQVTNVGTFGRAEWAWRTGDETDAKELMEAVLRLITGRGMTTAELVAATGARASRVGGALIAIQRSPDHPIYNLGTEYRGRWFVLPPEARDAHLAPKVERPKAAPTPTPTE